VFCFSVQSQAFRKSEAARPAVRKANFFMVGSP
jgi:hypothetical protein